jgi:hypothetical protein
MSEIIIEYIEGDDVQTTPSKPFTALSYVEWRKNGRSYYAHADETSFDALNEADEDADEYEDSAGNWEHRGIPDEVREHIALLIAPSLRAKLPAEYCWLDGV